MYPHIFLPVVPRLLQQRNMLQHLAALVFRFQGQTRRPGNQVVHSTPPHRTTIPAAMQKQQMGVAIQRRWRTANTRTLQQVPKHEGLLTRIYEVRNARPNAIDTGTREQQKRRQFNFITHRDPFKISPARTATFAVNHIYSRAGKNRDTTSFTESIVPTEVKRSFHNRAIVSVLERLSSASRTVDPRNNRHSVNQIMTSPLPHPLLRTSHLPLTTLSKYHLRRNETNNVLDPIAQALTLPSSGKSRPHDIRGYSLRNRNYGSSNGGGGATINMHRGLIEHLSVSTHTMHESIDDIRGQVEQALLNILGNITPTH